MEPSLETNFATVKYVQDGSDVTDLDGIVWSMADEIAISTYWSGIPAPEGRHASARLLWSDASIHVRFDALVAEPLVVSQTPNILRKTIGLWDRDVCEVFFAPDRDRPDEYFEFEVAPTGEWLDVKLLLKGNERLSDWSFDSGMICSARTTDDRAIMAMEIPWTAFGKAPSRGDIWLGNLFRCVGTGAERGYLSWKPTKTQLPNFHVPDAFGKFHFV